MRKLFDFSAGFLILTSLYIVATWFLPIPLLRLPTFIQALVAVPIAWFCFYELWHTFKSRRPYWSLIMLLFLPLVAPVYYLTVHREELMA